MSRQRMQRMQRRIYENIETLRANVDGETRYFRLVSLMDYSGCHGCSDYECAWELQQMCRLTWLSRYKVLLLKPHLRDMLALARRRMAIRCYSMLFVGFSSWSDVWYLQVMSLENFTHAFYWQRWDRQDVKESSPSQSRHRASRKGRDFGALWDWNDEVNEGIFGSSWTCLVSLSATSSRMFNQSPAHTAELGSNIFPDSAWQARASYLQMTCRLQMRKTMRRASSCRFFLVLFGWLACDALAGTTRNLVPACRLWQGLGQVTLTFTWSTWCMLWIVLTFATHVTDMWRTRKKLRLLRSVIAHREKAVQFLCLCRLKTVSSATLTWEDVGCADYRRSTAMYVMLI